MFELLLALFAGLTPMDAAYVAAAAVGRIDIAPQLIRICMRESRCNRVGIHKRDEHISRREWRGQVRLGHLDPKCQPYGDGGWATRGPWGLSAGAHWQYLPACYSPEILDVPIVSAYVAAQKYVKQCEPRRRRWCPKGKRRDQVVADRRRNAAQG